LSQPAEKSKGPAKIVIVANQLEPIAPAVAYLQKRDHQVETFKSLSEALENVVKGDCSYLMLSVDLPDSRPEVLPELLERSLDVKVIVFSEKDDKESAQRLANANSKNVLYAKLTGPTLLARLKQIEASAEVDAKLIASGIKVETAAGEIPFKVVPVADLLRAGTDPKAIVRKIWESLGVDALKREEAQTKAAPEVRDLVAKEYAEAKLLKRNSGQPDDSKKSKIPNAGAVHHEKVWISVDKALRAVCLSESKLGKMDGKVIEAELLAIDSINFKGTFVVAYAGEEGRAGSPIFAAEKNLVKELLNKGFHITEQDLRILPMFDYDIPNRLINSAEIVVTHSCRQFDVSLAYYSSTKLIPMFEIIEQPLQTVDIGQFLPDTHINVDVFLPLPLNKKYVRLWKRGMLITTGQLDKVAQHGALQLCVPTDQLNLFSQYCAYQAIHAEVLRYEQIRASRKKAA
jgi:DNA-binding response OmpR family regulator